MEWFLEAWKKKLQPVLNQAEMPELPQKMTEEGIKRLRDVGMLEQTYIM